MSPATIAIVSVVVVLVLMITVKIVVGKILRDRDQAVSPKVGAEESADKH